MALTTGWKTYAAAGALILVAGLKLFGVDPPGFEMLQPGPLLIGALGLIGLRGAIGRIGV